MSRPTNKLELLNQTQETYSKLFDFIESLETKELNKDFSEGTLNRNITDVLAHLHQWHLFFLKWYQMGMSGDKPAMPVEGYTWKTVPQLNVEIWRKFKNSDFEVIKNKLDKSHTEIITIINNHTDEELFTKKKFHWTGSTSMGSYLISSSSSHYTWALKLIKKGFK